MWLRLKDLLKEGCIPIETFDHMTTKRIMRIVKLQEKRLEEQDRYLEEKQKEQERRMNRRK